MKFRSHNTHLGMSAGNLQIWRTMAGRLSNAKMSYVFVLDGGCL